MLVANCYHNHGCGAPVQDAKNAHGNHEDAEFGKFLDKAQKEDAQESKHERPEHSQERHGHQHPHAMPICIGFVHPIHLQHVHYVQCCGGEQAESGDSKDLNKLMEIVAKLLQSKELKKDDEGDDLLTLLSKLKQIAEERKQAKKTAA